MDPQSSIPRAVREAPGRGCRKDPMPIGTVVIRQSHDNGRMKRNRRFIKVRNDGPKARRWVLYSRWWWEKNKGPVPAGKVVFHKDGDELNDAPDNLAVGTLGEKLQYAHKRDPEMSARNRKNASAGTADFNRLTGKLHRLREFLKEYWYPVLDNHAVILNVPFRKRKPLMKWFGMDMSSYPKNGHGKTVIARGIRETGIRAVLGKDLAHAHYETYVKLDPEWKLPAGRSVMNGKAREKIEALLGTDLWKRAEEAAKLDLILRK